MAGVYQAWERWGKGTGVRIGIIDGGFTNLAALIQKGVLNADRLRVRTVLPEEMSRRYPLGKGIHGSAVTEVIHEIAPGAELYLYPTALMPSAWENAVRQAVDDRVHIINSSLNTTYGALNGIGNPNAYLDPAIDAGILYINSAGNNGNSCYVSQFIDTDQDGWHDFTHQQESNLIFLKQGETINASLTWDDYGSDPMHPTATQDLDLYLFYSPSDEAEPILCAASQNDQSVGSDSPSAPVEHIAFSEAGAPYTGFYAFKIKARRIDLRREINMRLIVEALDNENPPPNIFRSLQFSSRRMTMTKPADHPDVLAIAACGIDGNVHGYSGTGPTESGELKPDLTAYAGLLTSSMEKPFFGTSCAAPFAAGCAALLWQQYPGASAVKEQLRQRAIKPQNTGAPGHDPASGWGIISLLDPEPPYPNVELISLVRFKDTIVNEMPGFYIIALFQTEYAKEDQLFTSLYFIDEDGKYIQTPRETGMGVYTGKESELRITTYITPRTSQSAAFESWLFVPDMLCEYAGNNAQVLVKVELKDGRALAVKRFGRVSDLMRQ